MESSKTNDDKRDKLGIEVFRVPSHSDFDLAKLNTDLDQESDLCKGTELPPYECFCWAWKGGVKKCDLLQLNYCDSIQFR